MGSAVPCRRFEPGLLRTSFTELNPRDHSHLPHQGVARTPDEATERTERSDPRQLPHSVYGGQSKREDGPCLSKTRCKSSRGTCGGTSATRSTFSAPASPRPTDLLRSGVL